MSWFSLIFVGMLASLLVAKDSSCLELQTTLHDTGALWLRCYSANEVPTSELPKFIN